MGVRKPLVAGIGEILWDMLPSGKSAGGAPVNFVYHAINCGAGGYAVTAVGNDAPGYEISALLKAKGVKAFIYRSEYPTGQAEVVINEEGAARYGFLENSAWDYLSFTKKAAEAVAAADAVCFGTLASRNAVSRETVEKFLSKVSKNALRLFDINLREPFYCKELIESLLKRSNILKMNENEAAVLRSMFRLSGNDEELLRFFIERYDLKYAILTAGAQYSIICSPEENSKIKTPEVDVADTVGAGDAFSAAFVCAILYGQSLYEAHKKAVEISAFACTKNGAWFEYAG